MKSRRAKQIRRRVTREEPTHVPSVSVLQGDCVPLVVAGGTGRPAAPGTYLAPGGLNIQVPEAADPPVPRPPAKRYTLQTVETHRIADNHSTPYHVICLQEAHCLQVTQSPCTRTSQPSKDEV